METTYAYNRRRVNEHRRRIAKMKKVKRLVTKVLVPIVIILAVIIFIKGTVVHIQQEHSVKEVIESPENTSSAVTENTMSNQVYRMMSSADKEELATLVYLEAGGESYECQKAVASVILNRMELQDASLQQIIYEENQFEPAENIPYSSPSKSTLKAVDDILTHGPSIPSYVTYFRADYYHDWSEFLIPYIQIDNTYFSYDYRLVEEE